MAGYVGWRDGGATGEEGLGRHLGQLYDSGVALSNDADAFEVTQRSAGANMSVDVAIGNANIARDDYAYWVWSDAVTNVPIDAADPSNPRLDVVVAYVDLSVVDDSSANNPGALVIESVSGSPAGVPSAPNSAAIESAIGAGNPYIILARVSVAAAASNVVDANITDLRVDIASKLGAIEHIPKRVTTVTSSGTITADADTTDIYEVTALAVPATIGVPTGTPYNGQSLLFRITDNGTARALTWNSIFRAFGAITLPTTTTVNKTVYIGAIYHSADTKWDVVGMVQEA